MNQHVLIVEDHDGVRKSLWEWMRIAFPQYPLLEATTGEEAVAVAQAMSPRLVIMDIGLPGMTGIEATQRIKAAVPTAMVVMLTIYDDAVRRGNAAAAGADAYVTKAKVQIELLPVLNRLLTGDEGDGTR